MDEPRGVTRAAAVIAWLSGLGFGVPGVYGAWVFAERGYVWTFLGFPTYGDGPLEDWGIEISVPLLGGFVAVCAAEVVAGGLLWAGRRSGLWVSLVLLPFEFVYWVGFALPLGPLFGIVRTALVVVALTRSRVG